MVNTTISISKEVKEDLDKVTPRSMTYSERLSILLQESNNNDLIGTYNDAINSTADYVTLDKFTSEMEKEFGSLK